MFTLLRIYLYLLYVQKYSNIPSSFELKFRCRRSPELNLNWPFVFIIHCYLDHSINSYLFHLCHKQTLIVTTCMVWFFCLQKNSNNFGIAGLALFQWGWCGANVYLKVLGSAATSGPRGVVSLGVISPASREAESPSQLLSLSLLSKTLIWCTHYSSAHKFQ